MITKLLNEVNENIKTLNNLVQDKEYFKKLEERIEKVNNYVQEQKQEIERLNNIIKELEKELDKEYDTYITKNVIYGKTFKAGANVFREHMKYKLQELKGDDKECLQ